jgi:hypothetical protein
LKGLFEWHGYSEISGMDRPKYTTSFYYDESSIHCKGYLMDDQNKYVGQYEFYKELDKAIYTSAAENDNLITGRWIVENAYIDFQGGREKIDEINYIIKFQEISTPLVVESKQ